ncbi:c6 transcription factor [Fusarium mexicanum]|uniref:C6 transcription factor n=1 Tax=Fusarium mexicanum TaxID=751941 RepID=A0A8H5I799_9HYPO|nr:c6 transcription factor [Fusarium mexicanum]
MEDTGQTRTPRACAPCRRKKVKCPGERPVCSFCQRLGQACEYKPVESFSAQDIQRQISGITSHDRIETLETKMDQILEALSTSRQHRRDVILNCKLTSKNTIDGRYRGLIRWNRSISEDQELLRAGQLYQTWCHNQPVYLFRQEDFLDTLKDRDKELQLAVKMLSYRFPPGQMTPDKQEALSVLSAPCRKLSLQGSIPDIAKPANIQGLFQSANHLLELINHRAEKFPLAREPSAEAESNNNRGILAYVAQAAKVWHLARAYAAMRVGPDNPPPWSTQSDYALVNLRNLELDCRFPLEYRFATNHFGELPPEVLQQRRDYWGPWIFIQFIHAAIPTLLNHPFLLSLRLKNFRHMIPQTFMYQSFDLISKHTAWIICYLDLVEKQQFEITDPTIGHAIVIVATIHLQHSFVEDSVLRTKAQHGYDKCMRFLDNMGSTWPVVFTMVSLKRLKKPITADSCKTQKLRRLQDSIATVPASGDRPGETQRSWSIDAQLLWELLVYEKAGRDKDSSGKSMYDDIITSDAEGGEQDVGGDFAIVGSAGISGHKGALREISAYAPQDKDPYETLGNLATPGRNGSRMQESSIFGGRNFDNPPDFGTVDQDNFLLQSEDFGRAVNDWMNLDMADIL